jgi:hypothetical protein
MLYFYIRNRKDLKIKICAESKVEERIVKEDDDSPIKEINWQR